MLFRQLKNNTLITLLIKVGAISFLLLLSILIVACSGSGGSQVDPGTPVATVTINLGQVIGSATPTLSPYYCGGWATDTSPAFNLTSFVSVFGKFTHIGEDGNPEGVGDAQATATILWPDGTNDTLPATTTSDGLAVFPVAIKPSAVNKLVIIWITFTKPGIKPCTIPSAAYFTAIMVSHTPTKTALPSSTGTGTPSVTPTPGGTVTSTGTPRPTP